MSSIIAGKASFNPEAFKDVNKADFKKQYADLVKVDLDDVWKKIQGSLKKTTKADKSGSSE